jgi:NAD(P)-dependent dehydrogenase (short-subunit alcohol dehydrogenase family)
MDNELEGRVALITGAGRGIGAACARVMSRRGADVVINYCHSAQEAEDVANDVRSLGRRAFVVQADVSKPDQVQAMVNQALAEFGRIDILVNNAGRHNHIPIDEMALEQWYEIIDTNLTSQMLCIKAVIAGMKERGWGRIVNLAAEAALRASGSGDVSYSASKAGVLGVTRAIFQPLAKYGITVNAVAPGPTDTDMVQLGIPPDRVRGYVSRTPVGRLGRPEEIAELVSFLSSERASYITGQVISINGGLSV